MTRTYRCPNCEDSDGLWEAVLVPGWRALDSHLNVVQGSTWREREVFWDQAETDDFAADPVGCGECGWTGQRDEFVLIGTDGQPLAVPIPGQEALEIFDA